MIGWWFPGKRREVRRWCSFEQAISRHIPKCWWGHEESDEQIFCKIDLLILACVTTILVCSFLAWLILWPYWVAVKSYTPNEEDGNFWCILFACLLWLASKCNTDHAWIKWEIIISWTINSSLLCSMYDSVCLRLKAKIMFKSMWYFRWSQTGQCFRQTGKKLVQRKLKGVLLKVWSWGNGSFNSFLPRRWIK